jgi:hypothetical protein
MVVGSAATTFIILPHSAQGNENGGAVSNRTADDQGMTCSLKLLGATVAVLGAGLELMSRGL